jgi:hypothetical protein
MTPAYLMVVLVLVGVTILLAAYVHHRGDL